MSKYLKCQHCSDWWHLSGIPGGILPVSAPSAPVISCPVPGFVSLTCSCWLENFPLAGQSPNSARENQLSSKRLLCRLKEKLWASYQRGHYLILQLFHLFFFLLQQEACCFHSVLQWCLLYFVVIPQFAFTETIVKTSMKYLQLTCLETQNTNHHCLASMDNAMEDRKSELNIVPFCVSLVALRQLFLKHTKIFDGLDRQVFPKHNLLLCPKTPALAKTYKHNNSKQKDNR